MRPKNNNSNSKDLGPIEEIKQDYLNNKDFFGNRQSIASLYKKYHERYPNLNRRFFLAILNEAHKDVGSRKRYNIYKKRNKIENKLIYSDVPPNYYK